MPLILNSGRLRQDDHKLRLGLGNLKTMTTKKDPARVDFWEKMEKMEFGDKMLLSFSFKKRGQML